MMMRRRADAQSDSCFGRGARRDVACLACEARQGSVGADLRLFALTFAGGFLFVSVYLL